jgi:hypothetical protein
MTVNYIEAAHNQQIASLAARWISSIDVMASDLACVLDDFLQAYQFGEMDDDDDGPDIFHLRDDIEPRNLVFGGHVLGHLRHALHLVNSYRPDIPFPERILGDLFLTSPECSSWTSDFEFTNSVTTFLTQLSILRSYQQLLLIMPIDNEKAKLSGELRTESVDSQMETLLRLSLDHKERTIHRDGMAFEHINPIPLSPSLWHLLMELLRAGRHGTTPDFLAETLGIKTGALSQRKNQLKNSLYPLDITIPDGRFRLAER